MDEKRRSRLVLLIVPALVLLMVGGSLLYRTAAVIQLDRKHDAFLTREMKSAENRPPSDPSPEPEQKPPPAAPPPASVPKAPAAPATKVIGGKVSLPDGGPAAAATVDLFVADASNRHSRHTLTTDEHGAFVFDFSPHSRMILTAHAPGFARALYYVPDAEDVDGVYNFNLLLKREVVAVGTVERADGSPLAGATLKFHPFRMGSSNPESDNNWNILTHSLPADPEWDAIVWKELFLTDCEVTSTATGEFRAPSLWSGIHYVVEVIREGGIVERLGISTVRREDRPVRLRLSR